MLLFSPDVEQWLSWFELTYEFAVDGNWMHWRRVALPCAGALGEQPAKLIEALTFIAQQRNAALVRRKRRTRTDG